MNFSNKVALVTIFSDSNFLSINILESLLAKNCFVNIITEDVAGWQEKTTHINNRSRLSVLGIKGSPQEVTSYTIIVEGFLRGMPYEAINEIFRKYNLSESKNLIIIPLEKFSFSEDSHFRISENTGIIYVGDIFGPRMDLESDLLAPRLIESVMSDRKITLGVGELIYPVFVPDVARIITKWLFSFGPFGKQTLLIGPQTSGTLFWQDNQSVVGEIKIHYDEKLAARVVPKGLDVRNIQCDLKSTLTETYRWFSKNPPGEKIHRPPARHLVNQKTKKRTYPKFLKPLLLSILAILTLPLVLLTASAILFFASYQQFLFGRDQGAVNSLLITKTLLVISKGESAVLSFIPVLGRFYKETGFVSGVAVRASDIGIAGIPVAREASTLTGKIFGNQVYDPKGPAQKLTDGLDLISGDISLLQVDAEDGLSKKLLTARALQNKINLEKLKNLALLGKTLSAKLAELTGGGGAKTYLLLFENNMELRPTGGFIGSFGILTFDGGRIADLAVNDVYSADGQLNGHVEPPAPIKKYLGEANWWLRDSNWDPDFPTSAKRAEWFLDKETGRTVDGVIAIDLAPIKDILRYTGPIFLSDFNLDITSENIYQKTQEEVQDDFFPGTHKKASFLTALSRNLLSQFSKLTTRQKVGLFKSFYLDFEGRHIQAFLHDDTSQNAISQLGWDGAVNIPNCGNGCFGDIIGLVEANVGFNKVNYFIKRSEDLSVVLKPDKIERKLTLTLENQANPQLGPSGRYRVYIRLITPSDSQILSARSVTGEVAEDLPPEVTELKGRRETGVLVEILGGQSKKVEFSWGSDIQNPADINTYGLYLRKQAGIDSGPFTLTINGRSVYNRPLVSDYFDRFPFK